MLMGLSLLVASTGWAGLIFAHSVLDAGQSGRLSTELMNHDGVRAVLTNRLGEGMERHVPVDEPMSRQELRSVAAEALDDPRAAAALRDALSEAHLLGLAAIEAEPDFSAFDVNEASRHALLAARPSLHGRILVNPLVEIRLPVEGLTWFSGLKALVDRFAALALALSMVGFTTSFIVADEPTPVLRRGAWWILAVTAGWIAAAPAFAAAVRYSVPSSYIVVAVAVETVLRSMRHPAIVMAAFGIGLLSMSYLAPALARRRGALLLERARRRPRRHSPDSRPAEATGSSAGDRSAGDGSAIGPMPPYGPAPAAKAEHVGVGTRLSAAWKEGHGYLDDARVAPFFPGHGNDG